MPEKPLTAEQNKALGIPENLGVSNEGISVNFNFTNAVDVTNLPNLKAGGTAEQDGVAPLLNPHITIANVNEETNFEGMSNEIRNELLDKNRALYGALFFSEYGWYPKTFEWPDKDASEKIVKNIKKTQLKGLRKMSYDALRKAGKLNRLKTFDILAYNKMLQRGRDEEGEDNPNDML